MGLLFLDSVPAFRCSLAGWSWKRDSSCQTCHVQPLLEIAQWQRTSPKDCLQLCNGEGLCQVGECMKQRTCGKELLVNDRGLRASILSTTRRLKLLTVCSDTSARRARPLR